MEVLDLNQNQELQAKLKKYRLRPEEHQRIRELLKREPQGVEWALFSALWSEHCSYKSSRLHLRKFKFDHPRILTEEGENAGVVDLGEGESIAFKMESHNHPSFIEPFHGAATGVGGILRDIFTMGARPIALANYLCFGESQAPRMPYLMKQVVKGISYYGNCVGVPTVTGATYSLPEYNDNILVNAFALGLFEKGQKITVSKAQGAGNLVVYAGAKTGSDGVHGASMASEAFDENMESKRPTVQIGDPFYEKLLIEACLEVLEKDLVVAMQDMGAAGLTSSSFEMASKGKIGFNLHLDRVPLRDSSLGPEEILLSESQERMLLVCEPKNLKAIEKVFHHWGLEATVIGEVISERKVRLMWNQELLTEIDPDLIVEQAPRYDRPYNVLKAKPLRGLEAILQTPPEKLDSKKWIYRQYDQRVGLRTERSAGHQVALIRLPSERALSIALGCRPQLMKQDAVVGAYDSVFEPALKMLCAGAWPVAITDCLNFGNPEKPEIMSEFVASVEALAHSAKLWDAPVISGNVSFYNETENRNIISTPAVGVVGLREKDFPIIQDVFCRAGAEIGLLTLQGLDEEFNPEAIVEKAKMLFNELRKGEVTAARLVTEKGLIHTLNLMSTQGFECDSQQDFKALQSQVKPQLYSVVLEASATFWNSLKRIDLKLPLKSLGRTRATPSSFSMIELENRFKSHWGI